MSDKPEQFITGLFRVVTVPQFASDLKPGSYQMELLADVEPTLVCRRHPKPVYYLDGECPCCGLIKENGLTGDGIDS